MLPSGHGGEGRVYKCMSHAQLRSVYIVAYILLHTQRWTLQHGTTTVAYSAPSTQESNRELVRVIGKFCIYRLVGA